VPILGFSSDSGNDDALYDAKRCGRNMVFLSNPRPAVDDTRHAQPATTKPGKFGDEFREKDGLVGPYSDFV